ncbi:MAG: PQQ-binding-like beta-propeller repeat protein [Pseudomonadota bacterium]
MPADIDPKCLSTAKASNYRPFKRVDLTFAGLFLLVLLSLLLGLPTVQAANENGGDLDDPDIKAQLQGAAGGGDEHPGAKIYQERCANCHASGMARAPARNILELMSPNAMLFTLTDGIMQQQSQGLSAEQKQQIVEYLVGEVQTEKPALALCADDNKDFDFTQAPVASGWGIDAHNTRHVPASVTSINADNIGKLEVKWVFDYPLSARARSHPSIAGGAVHVGSQTGTVYALDQETGCVRWVYEAGAEVRTGITIPNWSAKPADKQRAIGYFSDVIANAHAVDLTTGELLWKVKVDEHPNATLTAQPVYFEGRIYQAVSSLEVVPAADPQYPCCSFRGAIAILDANDGSEVKKIHTIPEAPVEVAKNNVGVSILAPSGAPVWNSPTLDIDNRRLYFGTGENYSSPAEGNSDAIIALNIDKQEINWVQQTTARDAWNVACMEFIANKTNCPEENGPDVDFGAPPILVTAGSDKPILVAGQKSGEVFGISPIDGKLMWRNKIGRGGNQGGMHFGMAADGDTVYVPISDYTDASLSLEDARPGIYAVNAHSGKLIWSHPAPNTCGDKADCDPGISAAVTSIDGAVLAGHMDGYLRAYSREKGEILWEVDTNAEFTSVAGRTASGGSFGGGTAPIAYRDMLYANSGYGLYFHMPGNVLIAWGLAD